MDNKFVIMVSAVHNIVDTVISGRRRPRVTLLNKDHVDEVWGTHKVSCYFFITMFFTNKYWKGKIAVTIPRFINDYNLWMGGVDQAGQLIAYYLLDMRCHRNWLPIFIHSLSTIRVNSFIVYTHTNSDVKGKRGYNGKEFALDYLDVFMSRAAFFLFRNWNVNRRDE